MKRLHLSAAGTFVNEATGAIVLTVAVCLDDGTVVQGLTAQSFEVIDQIFRNERVGETSPLRVEVVNETSLGYSLLLANDFLREQGQLRDAYVGVHHLTLRVSMLERDFSQVGEFRWLVTARGVTVTSYVVAP